MVGKRREGYHPHSWTAPGMKSGFYARGRSQKMNCISFLDSRIQTLSLLLGFLQVPLKCMHIMKMHSPFKPPTARASQRRFGFLKRCRCIVAPCNAVHDNGHVGWTSISKPDT